MKNLTLILFILSSFIACKPELKGTSIAFSQICDNSQKMVEVVGYLQLPPRMECSATNCHVHFWEGSAAQGQWHWASFKVGSGKNEMQLPPQSYKASDLKIQDFQGNIISSNQKVKITGYVTGKLTPTSPVSFCDISVEKIEKL